LFIKRSSGVAIKTALDAGKAVKLVFGTDTISEANGDAGDFDSSTSWGTAPSLDFKPEIAAPGGDIYSTVNNNKYETMSGTSMAAPHASGAELILTEGAKGMKGAIAKAEELAEQNPNYFIPQQFVNVANPNKHYESTAKEILEDIPDLTAFVTGVGTGGTITGVGRNLKEKNSNILVNAVEPIKSSILSGGTHSPHKIQGIGAGFIPEIYDNKVVDKVTTVSDEDAFNTARLMASEEGILVGISSGAAIYAALTLAKELGSGKKVLVVAPDGGEKYISMGIYE